MNHTAHIADGWELHMVGGTLYITSEANPDIQVALSRNALYSLIDYTQTALAQEREAEAVGKLLGYIKETQTD
jgi:hypothetical protein